MWKRAGARTHIHSTNRPSTANYKLISFLWLRFSNLRQYEPHICNRFMYTLACMSGAISVCACMPKECVRNRFSVFSSLFCCCCCFFFGGFLPLFCFHSFAFCVSNAAKHTQVLAHRLNVVQTCDSLIIGPLSTVSDHHPPQRSQPRCVLCPSPTIFKFIRF